MKRLVIGLILLLIPALSTAAEISLFAASSLTEALTLAAQTYQNEHPDTKIMLHFAGSQTLATQIEQGAPADLFISANSVAMARLEKSLLVASPQPLLRNNLIVALARQLRPRPSNLKELGRPGLLLAVGNTRVPVGNYTQKLFAALAADPHYGEQLVTQIKQNIVSQENMVKAIIAKLLLGEIDAGIVYRSDLAAPNARELIAMELPAELNPQAEYPLAKIKDADDATDAFIHFLFSARAEKIFLQQGFQFCGQKDSHAAL